MSGHPYIPHNIDRILAPKKKRIGVWRRRPEAEVKEIEKKITESKYSLVMPIGMFLSSMFGCHISMNLYSHSKLSYCFAFGLIVFIISYIFQILYGRAYAGSPRMKICKECLREDRLRLRKCYCGGLLEPPDYYEFIEKDK